MRLPDPIANTTTEAYLAYKAGVLSEGDLKPKLYDPYIHFDAWLAYWAGLVNTYPVDKNNDPEMLTDEEALVAYLSGVTNTYPEEFRDPADVRVAAYLKYLVSARFGRPEYPVNNEEFYLSLMKTAVVTNDTPSSDIELDNTCEAPFIDVKAYGDTSQQTYTGKNLLTTANVEATTRHGITLSYDANTQTITLNGTCDTNNTVFHFVTGNSGLVLNGTYALSCFVISGTIESAGSSRIQTADSDWTVVLNKSLTSKTSSTIEAKSFTLGAASIRVESGAKFTNYKIRIQLEKNNARTDWEPFVGRTAAPNPSYPQTVKTVTGENVVRICGKNLFDKSNASIFNGYMDYGLSLIANSGATTIYVPCEGGATYTVQKEAAGTNNRFCVYTTSDIPQGGGMALNYVGTPAGADNRTSLTITTNASAKYLCVSLSITSTTPSVSDILDTVQIEQGSTATIYQAYQGQDYEINLGKNLFDGSIYKTGYILSSDGSEISSTGAVITNQIEVEPNTVYTASAVWHTGTGDTYIRIGVYDKSMGWIVRYSGQLNKITFTTPANARYVRLSYYIGRTDSVQLELGSEATSYAPYFEPIELCKIGTYQDYIYEDEGEWKIHKVIDKVVLDGTESNYMTRTNTSLTHSKFRIVGKVLSDSIAGVTALCCSHFIANAGANDAAYSQNAICGSTIDGYRTQLWFSVENSIATTAAGFQTWVSNNKPYLYYALLTAADTTITNPALIAQLNALKVGGSYNGKTYIKVSATDPNLPALLKVEAGEYR